MLVKLHGLLSLRTPKNFKQRILEVKYNLAIDDRPCQKGRKMRDDTQESPPRAAKRAMQKDDGGDFPWRIQTAATRSPLRSPPTARMRSLDRSRSRTRTAI